jgi:hypothetical protein
MEAKYVHISLYDEGRGAFAKGISGERKPV